MKHRWLDLTKIVAFCGPAGSGKDTAAGALMDRGWAKMALADALKRDCVDWELCTPDEAWVTKPPHVRRLLQVYGTELRRQYDENYWLYRWAADYITDRAGDTSCGIVVPDVRFPNEAHFFTRKLGVPLVFVSRPGNGGLTGEAAVHSSEANFDTIKNHFGQSRWFVEVVNDGSIDDLHKATLAALKSLGVNP